MCSRIIFNHISLLLLLSGEDNESLVDMAEHKKRMNYVNVVRELQVGLCFCDICHCLYLDFVECIEISKSSQPHTLKSMIYFKTNSF